MTDQGNVSSHSQFDPHTTSNPIMELKIQTQQTRITDSYTESELALFQTRYENGYDLLHDDRYNTWVQEAHPDKTVIAQARQATTSLIVRFVSTTREQEVKLPAIPEASKIRQTPKSKVLTSEENLAELQKKIHKKEKGTREKQQR